MAAQSKLIGVIARKGHAALLVEGSDASLGLDSTAAELAKLLRAHEAAAAKTTNWLERLSPIDVAAALEGANATERSLFRFLNPSWWRLRRMLNARYDFGPVSR